MTLKKSAAVPVSVHILDKEFRVACPPEEREGLLRAATYLDDQMKKVRDGARIVGMDRIAVMAALNIAHELLAQKQSGGNSDDQEFILSRIKLLQGKIETTLTGTSQIEM